MNNDGIPILLPRAHERNDPMNVAGGRGGRTYGADHVYNRVFDYDRILTHEAGYRQLDRSAARKVSGKFLRQLKMSPLSFTDGDGNALDDAQLRAKLRLREVETMRPEKVQATRRLVENNPQLLSIAMAIANPVLEVVRDNLPRVENDGSAQRVAERDVSLASHQGSVGTREVVRSGDSLDENAQQATDNQEMQPFMIEQGLDTGADEEGNDPDVALAPKQDDNGQEEEKQTNGSVAMENDVSDPMEEDVSSAMYHQGHQVVQPPDPPVDRHRDQLLVQHLFQGSVGDFSVRSGDSFGHTPVGPSVFDPHPTSDGSVSMSAFENLDDEPFLFQSLEDLE